MHVLVAQELLARALFLGWTVLEHKTVKMNNKIRRFGVVMMPLLIIKENMNKIMQITACKVILVRRINIRGCKDYKNASHELSLIAR